MDGQQPRRHAQRDVERRSRQIRLADQQEIFVDKGRKCRETAAEPHDKEQPDLLAPGSAPADRSKSRAAGIRGYSRKKFPTAGRATGYPATTATRRSAIRHRRSCRSRSTAMFSSEPKFQGRHHQRPRRGHGLDRADTIARRYRHRTNQRIVRCTLCEILVFSQLSVLMRVVASNSSSSVSCPEAKRCICSSISFLIAFDL